MDGTEQDIGVVPRERLIHIEISDQQFESIVKLLSIIYPNSTEYRFFKDYYDHKLKKIKRVGGLRSLPMVVPKHVVKGILDLFIEFKSGTLKFEPREIQHEVAPTIIEKGTTKKQGLFAEGLIEAQLEDEEGSEIDRLLREMALD